MEKGFISDPDVANPVVETKGKAGVTKTHEYAYNDYSLALPAKELNGQPNYAMLMKRSKNYKYMCDPSTGLMRGRLDNGDWVKELQPAVPSLRINVSQSQRVGIIIFAPHDTDGLIGF